MANTAAIVTQIEGQAWLRHKDGSLEVLRVGMRIPVDAEVVTAAGSKVIVQGDESGALQIAENQQVTLSADLLQAAEPSEAAIAQPAGQDVNALITALNAGQDPLSELDPTEAVLSGGEGAGSTYIRLVSILENTTPLDLAYPRGVGGSEPTPEFSGGSVNQAPVANGILVARADEDSDVINGVDTASYFRDPENGALTFSATNLPLGLTINPTTGQISGTLDSSASQGGVNGVYNVTITATDPLGASTSLTFQWTVTNPPPDAMDDQGSAKENILLAVSKEDGLLSNDVDRDGDALKIVEITNASGDVVSPGQMLHGSNGGNLTVQPDGSYLFDQGTDFDYLPAGQSASVVFTYKISDGDGGFDTAKLVITITGTNDTPIAVEESRTIQESGVAVDGNGNWQTVPIPTPLTGNVLTNAQDADQGEKAQLLVTGVQTGENADPSTSPPAPLGATALQGTYGQLTLDSQGNYVYTLRDGSAEVEALTQGQEVYDVFTYEITDPQGAKDWAEIRIKVIGTNDLPIAQPELNGVSESGVQDGGNTPHTPSNLAEGNLLVGKATDVDAGETASLQVQSLSLLDANSQVVQTVNAGETIQTAYGSLQLNADGSYVYTLNNDSEATNKLAQGALQKETFSYVIVDVQGGPASATFTITITGTNDRPVIDVQARAGWDTDVKESDNGQGGDSVASGALVANDVDNGAVLSWKWVEGGVPVNAAVSQGTYGHIELQDGKWVYTLDQNSPATQALTDLSDPVYDTFIVRVIDEHGAWDEQEIRVKVTGTNDSPIASDDTIILKEDGRVEGNLITGVMGSGHEAGSSINADINMDGGKLNVISFTVDGQLHTVGQPIQIPGADGYTLGMLTINSNGDYFFEPSKNYSGKLPEIRYTVQEPVAEGGKTAEAGLSIEIIPVADLPTLNEKVIIKIDEDNSSTTRAAGVEKWIGLQAPVVTDAVDFNGNAVDGDNPERLGIITLTIEGGAFGKNIGQSGEKSIGYLNINGKSPIELGEAQNIFKIVIVDGNGHPINHTSDIDLNGVLQLTKEEYENITITSAANRGENIAVKVEVTSYEVDASGVALVGILGATNQTQTDIDVRAVTDAVELHWVDSNYSDEDVQTFSLKEDLEFDLKKEFKSVFEDVDGSENRWFTIVNNSEQSIFVNNVEVKQNTESGRINFSDDIKINGFTDYSGDVKGLVLNIYAQDTDPDSPSNTTLIEKDQLLFDLKIEPQVDGIQLQPVSMQEDTPANLWTTLGLTMGDSADGSQKIAQFDLNELPSGWSLVGPGGQILQAVNGKYSFVMTEVTLQQLQDVLDKYTVIPKEQSSKDISLNITWKVVDYDLNDPSVTPKEIVKTDEPSIIVRPVAEFIPSKGVSDDTNFNDDLEMTHGHHYLAKDAGLEDYWIKLNTNEFNLKDDWNNPDYSGNEQTFALLVPELVGGLGGDNAIGSIFRYIGDDGNWVEKVFNNSAVEVEVKYLDTLEFKAPLNVSGTFKIGVQAKTIDYDEDNSSITDTKISGSATLELFLVKPDADGIDALTVINASGLEDKPIALNIHPSSLDKSETFNVKIDEIPEGAQIIYDGKTLTAESANELGFQISVHPDGSWTLVIEGFESSKNLAVLPPPQSNVNFDLQVSAQSVDSTPDGQYTDSSDFEKQQALKVSVKGVADEVEISTKAVTLTEKQVDDNGHQVALKDSIESVFRIDNDGSETLNFRITGLEPGFTLVGAYPVKMGQGTERVWLVKSEAELQALKIVTPEHYSGTLNITVTPVTTEDDNDWHMSQSVSLSIVVTPSPESSLIENSVVKEDTIGAVHFGIANNFGDTNESLKTVWIKAADITADKGFELFLNGEPLLARTDLLENGYYQLGADLLGGVTGKALTEHFANNQTLQPFQFGVKYEVVDASTDGSISSTAEIRDGVYDLSIKAVTDSLQSQFLGMDTNDAGITSNGTTVSVTTVGDFGIKFDLQSPDQDGSEHVIQLEIAGIPDGLIIEGLLINNQSVGSVSFIGNNAWIVSIPSSQMPALGVAALEAQLNFRAGDLLAQHHNLPITITSISKDVGADNVSGAPIKWFLDSILPGNAPPNVVQLTWQENPNFNQGKEDTPFTMGQAFTSTMTVNDPNPNVHFTLKMTLPEGATVTYNGVALTPTSLGGAEGEAMEAWVVTGYGTAADINQMLDNLVVTPPANVNNNFGGLKYDATLTAYHEDTGSQAQKDLIDSIDLTPVTDDSGIAIELTKSGTMQDPEEGSPVDVRIQISNGVDGGSVLGEFLYVQLHEPSNFTQPGRLFDAAGNEVQQVQLTAGNPMNLPAGTYYQVVLTDRSVGLGESESIVLRYEPGTDDAYSSGVLSVNAWVERREVNSDSSMITVTQSASANLVGVSNGYDVEVRPELSMDENRGSNGRIELEVGGAGLRDSIDGSEAVFLALLNNVPKGFLVFVGQNAATADVAPNAGNAEGEGASWVIEVDAHGKLPPYIAIQPPKNWSGNIDGLELSVISGELNGDAVMNSVTMRLEVHAKADGVQTPIDADATFGIEGEALQFNLNISMKDAKAVVPDIDDRLANPDSSIETLSLRFTGLGAHAAFYVGTELLAFNGADRGFSFDDATGKYTVYGLSEKDSEQLSVLQSKQAAQTTITFDAWTVESSNGDTSTPVSGSFVLDIRSQAASNAQDNVLLFDGANVVDGKGGTDTVWMRFGENLDFNNGDANHFKNIEVIDLTREGFAHQLLNLSAQAVEGMTDSNHTLSIKADAGDTISLLAEDWQLLDSDQGDSWIYRSTGSASDGNSIFLNVSKDALLQLVPSAQARAALSTSDLLNDDTSSADSLLGGSEARTVAASSVLGAGPSTSAPGDGLANAMPGGDSELQQKLAQQLLEQGKNGFDPN